MLGQGRSFRTEIRKILGKTVMVHFRFDYPNRRESLLRERWADRIFPAELRLGLRQRDHHAVVIHKVAPEVSSTDL
jgi:hypothetical protein